MECHPGICSAARPAIARLPGEAEPRLVGTGRSVREVAALLAADGSAERVAERLGLDRRQVQAALAYLERFPDTIEQG